ncbi:lipoprotein [Pedobacter sp. W3I1]
MKKSLLFLSSVLYLSGCVSFTHKN